MKQCTNRFVLVMGLLAACTNKLPPEENAGPDAGIGADSGEHEVEPGRTLDPSEDAGVALPSDHDSGPSPEIDAGPAGCTHSRECSPADWCNPMNHACEPRASGDPVYFTDIRALMITNSCHACHSAGNEADLPSEQGDPAIILDTVNGAYDALVAEGISCWNETHRLCVDDPASSRFARKTLLQHDSVGQQSVAFESWDDKRLQTILRWIARGAPRESGAPVCGNHVPETGEECDLGKHPSTTCAYGLGACKVCSANCKLVDGTGPSCGDSHLDEAFEACDDGNKLVEETDQYGGSVCGPDCTFVEGFCGAPGQPCCDSDQGKICKFPDDVTCKTYKFSEWDPGTSSCVECGDEDEACCNGSTCHGEGYCYGTVNGGTCLSCGQSGEPPCNVDLGGPSYGCAAGLSNDYGTCVPCGGYYEACCPQAGPYGGGSQSQCSYGLVCNYDNYSNALRCVYPHY